MKLVVEMKLISIILKKFLCRTNSFIATLVAEENLHPKGRTKLVLFSDLTGRPPTQPPTNPDAVQMDCISISTRRSLTKFET